MLKISNIGTFHFFSFSHNQNHEDAGMISELRNFLCLLHGLKIPAKAEDNHILCTLKNRSKGKAVWL